MPIYNGMLPAIDKAEVKRYAGLRHAEDFPQQYVDEACKEIQLLATPKGVYQEYDYDAETKTILSNPPLKIEGSIIEKHLEKSTKVYVLGVTVGEDVEIRSEQLFKQGNYTVGLLLDAAATTAVEQVADQVNEVIKPQLAKIIKTEMIGLQVTENYLLFPRKSVTAIIGLMPADQDINTKRGCTSCSQKDCASRKAEASGIAMKGQPTE
ncbi:MAG: methionine synthase [Veillonella sp.]|nr:methionine synthase [Veillonella sp.]